MPLLAAFIKKHSPQKLFSFLLLTAIWGLFVHIFAFEWAVNEQYSYGFIVPVLTAYLIWLRVSDCPKPSLQPLTWFWIIPIIVGSLLLIPLYIVLGANPEWRMALWLQATISVGTTLCIIGTWGGWPWVRHFATPLLLIFLAVPWPTQIENPLVQGLMRIVASSAVPVLNMLGYYAVQHGNLIELSRGYVGVEEACSGVRSFQSTLMAAYFFGVLFRWKLQYRLALIVLGCAVSLVLNFLRTLTLTLVTANRGMEAMQVVHDPIGHVVSITSYLVLFLLTWGIHRWFTRQNPSFRSRLSKTQTYNFSQTPTVASIIGISCILLAPLLRFIWYYQPQNALQQQIHARMDWKALSAEPEFLPIPPAIRAQLRFSDGLEARWMDNIGNRWTAFFFRWDAGRISSHVSVHRPDVCMPAAGFQMSPGGEPIVTHLEGVEIRLENFIFTFRNQTYYVYFAVWDAIPGLPVPLVADWRDRLRAAWTGRRIEDRYSLQIIVSSHESPQNIERRVSHFVSQTLKPIHSPEG